MRVGAILCIVMIALIGCAPPTTDRATLKALVSECRPLLKLQKIEGLVYPDVPKRRWPHAIASLNPESVIVLQEGVFIQIGSFYVEGWGYFVPRSDHYAPKVGDSRYSDLGQGVFWYRVD